MGTHTCYSLVFLNPLSFQSHLSFTLPIRKILDSFKLKEFAGDNLKFDESGEKFSKWVENAGKKRDIACYEQFRVLSQCFQITLTANT